MMDFGIGEGDRIRVGLWIGCAGAAIAALFGIMGPHDASLWRTPSVLEARAEAALARAGMPGIDVVMNGQEAFLHGVLPDETAIASAARVALRSSGFGGAWAGGVTGVNVSGLEQGRAASPYSWRITRNARVVTLSGHAPSAFARGQLLAAARAAFPNADAPVDQMTLAAGAPVPNWLAAAEDAIAELSKLGRGEVRIVDTRIVLIGDGTQENVQAVRAHYQSPPDSFTARIEATADGAPVNEALSGLDLSAGDPGACEQAFAHVMERNVINFAPGSAEIDVSSQALLDSLASVALRCDRFVIEVSGHTDNQGARPLNMDLSRQRAQAVANYLAAQAVAADRLRVAGYGPDRPRQSNATPVGQAANRRIEFYVSG